MKPQPYNEKSTVDYFNLVWVTVFNEPARLGLHGYAQQALGHASKAVTEAYAADAQFILPALEEYEGKRNGLRQPQLAVSGQTASPPTPQVVLDIELQRLMLN